MIIISILLTSIAINGMWHKRITEAYKKSQPIVIEGKKYTVRCKYNENIIDIRRAE